jgi:hypothetical protein
MSWELVDNDAKQLRDKALSEWRAARARRFDPASLALPIAAQRSIVQMEKDLKRGYWESLPVVPISRCPIDAALIQKKMDIYGLDGGWWDVDGDDEPLFGDTHVSTYTGALKFDIGDVVNLFVPKRHRIRPGPEVPYVVPRLLLIPSVRCVISSMKLLAGRATAYFTTYFADPRISAAESYQPWLRQTFYFLDPTGYQRWRSCSDAWDFDIASWLRKTKDKIYWIAPEDKDMIVVTGSAERCPYVNLAGVRVPRLIERNQVFNLPLPVPSGEDYFD